ncbi:hypothetical protein RFI_02274 [Reticulomyxa filosa]|uniref:Uncharacterized protein n=1 Tax=Reticulomyxa filosa TaxID=46433 RepID=X6P8D9_RETFI|nr:hypothetical protein RFI_02274 [Reticulomyxa filosa]|eukprot:ETO34815.1 hypothetical protein RFI_02274 [Reticulomyxa filosa]
MKSKLKIFDLSIFFIVYFFSMISQHLLPYHYLFQRFFMKQYKDHHTFTNKVKKTSKPIKSSIKKKHLQRKHAKKKKQAKTKKKVKPKKNEQTILSVPIYNKPQNVNTDNSCKYSSLTEIAYLLCASKCIFSMVICIIVSQLTCLMITKKHIHAKLETVTIVSNNVFTIFWKLENFYKGTNGNKI